MTFETYIRERYRAANGLYFWRSHYLSEGDYTYSGDYFIANAMETTMGILPTTFHVTDRNGGTLMAGDTVTLDNQQGRKYYVWSTSSLLRGDRSPVTNGSDRFTVQVISRATGSPQPTGSGAVGPGTEVAFRTYTGSYLHYSNAWTAGAAGAFGSLSDDRLVWISR